MVLQFLTILHIINDDNADITAQVQLTLHYSGANSSIKNIDSFLVY